MIEPSTFSEYNRLHQIDRPQLVATLADRLRHESNLAFAYLYGSASEQKMAHDVDVGLYYHSKATLPSRDHILDLANQLSSAIHAPVDIRILNIAPLSFVFHVLRGELLTCSDPDLLSDILENTARQYLDIAPLRRQSTKDSFGS